jgi:hypothetical protein
MRKRVAGGVVLVAIGIGIWLSNLFTGIGPGGAGSNIGLSPDINVALDNSESTTGSETSLTSMEAEGSGSSAPQRPIVVIDAQEYFLEQRTADGPEYVPTSLDEIIRLAQQAEPDADGIRVQIKRRGSSRHSAEAALDAALRQAGLSEEQIQRHGGIVD